MFLKNIRLIHFKCHEDLFLDFDTGHPKAPTRKTTFLTGENGSGKSAVLQAIALVTGGSEALWSTLARPDDYIQSGQSFCAVTATIVTAQGDERALSLRLDRGMSRAAAVNRARTTMAPMNAALRHTSRSYFTAGYGSGRRVETPGFHSGSAAANPRYTAVQSLFSKTSFLRPLDAWVRQARHEGGEEGIAALGSALNTFLPLEVRFAGLQQGAGQPMFDTPDGPLPLHLLSNGYQQTVAWVSDLFYHVTTTFGNYKNPLSARGLLLIDELDLHLHPAWQEQVRHFLANGLPQFQVIATTYSALTTQHAAPGEVIELQRRPKSGATDQANAARQKAAPAVPLERAAETEAARIAA